MPRGLHKLSPRRVETLKTIGWHGDGGNLWLRLTPDGSKKWIFAWERDKRRREMGLGALAEVSMAQAREQAAAARSLLQRGLDPIEERRSAEQTEPVVEDAPSEATGVPLFGAFADTYIATHEDGWKNPKHRQQWRNTITTHAASILHKPVDTITSEDIVAVLQPIWRQIPETASRLRGRIENILDAAKASKHISSPWENPARWRGCLIHLLPRRPRKSQVKHHAALPYEQLPDFVAKLRRRPAIAARALEITILCATRTNETLRMTWSEVDLETAMWIVPAERMKMGVEHRIPLSTPAVAVIRSMATKSNCDPNAFVFPGQKLGRPLSQMSMTMVLRRMKFGAFTVHGMRSCFRDYMGDLTDHPESIVEQALAHQIGDETIRAYRRGDAFLKRRRLMQEWADYLASRNQAKAHKPARRGARVAQIGLAA